MRRQRKPPEPFRDSQEVRVDRALAEYGEYEVRRVAGADDRWFDIHKKNNGESYEVGSTDCTCDDFAVRCKRHGIVCKHVVILHLALDRGEVLAPYGVIPTRRAV